MMSTAPHPAFRKWWIEAAAADRAMRGICSLESAWKPVMNLTLDLPLLESDELVGPLMQFGNFEPPINEALARIDGERESDDRPEPAAVRQKTVGDSDWRRERAGQPFVSAVAPGPQPVAASNDPTESRPTKTETFSAIDRLVESHRMAAADNARRSEPISSLQNVSAGDNRMRSAIREVERQIRSSISNNPSRSTSDAPAITHEAPAADLRRVARAIERVPSASVEGSTSGAGFGSIRPREVPERDSVNTAVARVGGKRNFVGNRTTPGDLFGQVLAAAVERVRSTQQRQIRDDRIATESASRERELVVQRNPAQARPDFPRTGLQRLAAHALESSSAPSARFRSPREPEFASFTPDTCSSSIDSGEFASHLSALLRQEMARHGISFEDLEQ